MPEISPDDRADCGKRWFTTTHWSVVVAAGATTSRAADDALERLCRNYWYPLYSFVRQRGYPKAEAEDLTQGFFACFLEKRFLKGVAREKGKFRTFMLSALSHFLANEWDKSQRQKRGGGAKHLPFEMIDADERYCHDLAGSQARDPEQSFDRRWAETLLAAVLQRIRSEFEQSGKGERFQVIKPFLLGEPRAGEYAAAASRLRMSEQGVKSAVHRIRGRFRELVREEISHTVATKAEIEEELHYLVELMTA